MITENELWLMSFYRLSEINGAQFFAKLAATVRDDAIRFNMTRHFMEEAQHGWYWTECIRSLGAEPLNLERTYQDEYFKHIGIPANLMEVLAITQVFERRVINHYARQSRRRDLNLLAQQTIERIMADERWHLQWVSDALDRLAPYYGAERIRETLDHYRTVDKSIYQRLATEHDERVAMPGTASEREGRS